MNTIIGIFWIIHVPCRTIDEPSDWNMYGIVDKIDQQNLMAMIIIHLIDDS